MSEESQYNVFHRTWWKKATRPGWPNDREPQLGDKIYLAEDISRTEAITLCEEWNSENEEGPYSDRAEFEEA